MFDLLVLGAGLAGCAAAIHARRAGLKVIMLDRRDTVRPVPGETLHPGIESIFAVLGVRDAVLAAGFHRHQGIWIEWDGPRRFEAYGEDTSGPWLGFQADRTQLHGILLRTANALGVVVRRPAIPEAVIRDETSVRGVILSGCEVRARWTADATGSHAWLADQLGLNQHIVSPQMHAQFGWRDGSEMDSSGQPLISAHPFGWNWQASLGNNRTAWVSLTVDELRGRGISSPGRNVTWRMHEACAGAGYFLLGDAAAVLDPTSSHGVMRALMSGIWCADMIAGLSRNRLSASEAVLAYRRITADQFEHDVRAMRELYRRHPSTPLATLFAA